MILNAGGSGWGDNRTLTLLWENPDTTVEFGHTTIQMDLSKYQLLLVLTKTDTTKEEISTTMLAIPEAGKNYEYDIGTLAGSIVRQRTVNLSDNYIEFGSSGSNNTACVPYRIYGAFHR